MKKEISRRKFALQSGLGLLALTGVNKIAAAPTISPVPELSEKAGPLSEKFLAQLPKMMELAGVPGVATAVIEKGRVTWSGEYGLMNAEKKQPVTKETVFAAASLGKVVFAYGVLVLRDEGKIDLDRPLINYFPEDYIPNEPRAKSITARHVLSHSTGLQNWRFQKTQQLQLAFSPGEQFSYSGEGFFYLQRVVEKITGLGLEQFMRERVFKPLGMSSSSYLWLPEYEKTLSAAHTSRGLVTPAFGPAYIPKMLELAAKWNKPLETWRYEEIAEATPLLDANFPVLPNFMMMNAAGSLQTTAADYSRLLLKLLNEPDGAKFSLKNETINEMLTPQIKINSALSWGLGIGLENQNGNSYFWHWGDNGNFKNFVIGNRAKKWAMVVFTNARNGHKLWERIVREATGEDHASFLWV